MAELSERAKKLETMLAKTPGDPFLLYGLAMEHKKAGDHGKAIDYLDRTLQADAGYCYAYFQKGQTFELDGRIDEAKNVYRKGIAAAIKKGDEHARSEIEGALQMIE
jgi:tetratricopeptide (TPR) repeat protein